MFNFKKSPYKKILLTLIPLMPLLGMSSTSYSVEPLQVEKNRILIGGKPGSIAGNSLFWSNDGWGGERYYTKEVVDWLVSDWNTQLVRAAMGVDESGGYLSSPDNNFARVKTVIDAAIDNDIYVIVDWHSHHAERYPDQAVEFFTKVADMYGEYDNIIYEVYNEPLQVSWSKTVKPYAEKVIAAIRKKDPDNLIVVGTPNWSQRVDQASLDPIDDVNTAYVLHFYAGTHKDEIRENARKALANGAALFVTEWGSSDASGDGKIDTKEAKRWMKFLKENQISHASWALNDKDESASQLKPGASTKGGWSKSKLTKSGKLSKKIIENWNTENTKSRY